MRAALYARYSNERQNERSADDQLAACRAHAKAKGWTVIVELKDEAISGALMVNRPAVNALMAMADAGGFDVLLTEDEDRVARNLEHQAHVYNRLEAAGIIWATLYTERVELMHVAFKGMLAQQYLVDLSRKTRRGVRANAEAGKATGGRLFGYVTEPGGAIAVVPAEAELVREIFTRYAAGESAQGIAADLNRRAITGARGGAWTTAQISGSRQRANGVLQTQLYAGVKVWNRMEVKKDPATGARRPVMKPESEWRRTPVPHLAILSAELWAAVQARKGLSNKSSPRTVERRRAGVFTGLVKCVCGANYSTIAAGRLGCSAAQSQGPAACSNTRTVSRRQVEERLLHGLQTNLMAPAAIQLYVEEYHRAWTAQRKRDLKDEGRLRGRLGEAQRRIERLIDDIQDGRATPDTKTRLIAITAERDQLAEQLAVLDNAAEPPIELHPSAPAEYARQVGALQHRLAQCGDVAEAAGEDQQLVAAIRDLVDHVVLRPKASFAGAPYDLEIHGRLGPLTGATYPTPFTGEMVAGGSNTLPPPSVPQTFLLVA